MKVLHVITQGVWGGAQRHVYDVATEMGAHGVEVVVAHGAGDLLPQRLNEQGIKTIRIEKLRRDVSFFDEFSVLSELLSSITAEQPSLIHAHSSKMGGLCGLAGLLKGIPVVFTSHGWPYTQPRPLLVKVIYWLLSLLMMVLAKRVVAVSEYVKRVAPLSSLFSYKTVVIKNAITCDTRPALPHPAIPPYDKLLITIAELHPTKGLDILIRALPLLPPSLGTVHLLIAGSGSEEARLRTLIEKLHVTESVTLLGFVRDAHLLLPHADLFVLPSRSEALAYVLLEAGCAGVPVLGSDRGGIPEVAPMTVSLSPHSLAQGIETLLTHDAMRKENADVLHKKVRSDFALETMIRLLRTLYTDLA